MYFSATRGGATRGLWRDVIPVINCTLLSLIFEGKKAKEKDDASVGADYYRTRSRRHWRRHFHDRNLILLAINLVRVNFGGKSPQDCLGSRPPQRRGFHLRG